MKPNRIKSFKGYRWIVVSPDLLGCQPTIKGTRISVSLVLQFLADGMTAQEISNDYPGFPVKSVSEVLRFASENINNITHSDVAA